MPLITRRNLLLGMGTAALGTTGVAGYAVAVEPFMVPRLTRYTLVPPHWPQGLVLRVAVIADIHACEPWMAAERVRSIADAANALNPDLILLLGDYNAGHKLVTAPVMPGAWAEALSILQAPLGVYSILGNHDWWHGPVPGMPGGPEDVRRALRGIRVTVLENSVVPIRKDGRRLWLAGLADQMAHRLGPHWTRGADDLTGTLAQVNDDGPIILLAHEPFVFRHVPDRVSLTLCGHTHGGQVNLPIIGAPFAPSRRYVYGQIVENQRHMIISGGLGESGLPVRLGVPPEILEITLGGPAPLA